VLGDIQNPRWLYFKAFLLLGVGLLASTILILESPHLRTVGLLGLAVWGFARAYYFAFYVVEHYIDPTCKFAGLLDFARHAMSRRRASAIEEPGASASAKRPGD
jgi:hypothetical protein